jgi:hypothetical protein
VQRTHLVEPFEGVANADEAELARLELAWGKAALFFRTGYRLGHPNGSMRCMSLLEIYRLLEVHRQRVEAGNTLALLQAIGVCMEENLPAPTWLANAFLKRITEFLRPGKMRSLDEVFSSKTLPTASARKAAAVRQDWQLGATLWSDAWDLARQDSKLSSYDRVVDALLKRRDYGVAKTKAKRLISTIEKNQSELLGKDLSLSRFLEKRRKLQT